MADRVASDAESSRRDRTKNEATRKRSAATKEQTRRPGLFGGIWLFFKQVIDEMKKVTYPTGSETWTYFLVVVVFVGLSRRSMRLVYRIRSRVGQRKA